MMKLKSPDPDLITEVAQAGVNCAGYGCIFVVLFFAAAVVWGILMSIADGTF